MCDHFAEWLRTYEPSSNWALSKATLCELDRRLWDRMPKRVVETGSGVSTKVLANYARHTGAEVLSLEHDRRFLNQTRDLLGDDARYVNLVHARLASKPPIYVSKALDEIGEFEFALIDGPPSRLGGRRGMMSSITRRLNRDSFEVWVDDADRTDEMNLVSDWQAVHKLWAERVGLPRGLARLSPVDQRRPVDASNVSLSILTGHRPTLFADTLANLPEGLLETAAEVIVYHNGTDEPTKKVLDRIPSYGNLRIVRGSREIVPAGTALGTIAGMVQSPYWMHLEDDWRFTSACDTWLADAIDVLESDSEVAQVRLRHLSEQVMSRHQVTGDRILWQPHPAGLVSHDAHLTNNPMLVRSHEYAPLWPCKGERAMQPVAWEKGMRKVVQLHPGGFFHMGGSDSLRRKTKQ